MQKTIFEVFAEEYANAVYGRTRRERRRRIAKRRKRNRIRETVGAFVAVIGFVLMIAATSSMNIRHIWACGVMGLALFALGAWLGHMFFGQEADAEWLRRMRGENR